MVFDTGPIATEHQLPCQTPVACLSVGAVLRSSALTTEHPPGGARGGSWGGAQVKLNAVWILNLLASTTRRTEKQKLWAKTAACTASRCAPVVARYFEEYSSQRGGGGGAQVPGLTSTPEFCLPTQHLWGGRGGLTRFAYSAPAFLLQRKAPMTCH